jgi:hypothetical protein
MSSFGSMLNHKLVVAQATAAEWAITQLANQTEKKLILVPEAGSTLHVLLTTADSEVNADADDLLVPAQGLYIGSRRNLGRITVFNSGSGSKNLYISVLS